MFFHLRTTVRLSVCLSCVRSTVVSSYRLLAHLIPSLSFLPFDPGLVPASYASGGLVRLFLPPHLAHDQVEIIENVHAEYEIFDFRLTVPILCICIRVSRLTLKLPLSKTILLNLVISILHEAYQVDSTCV